MFGHVGLCRKAEWFMFGVIRRHARLALVFACLLTVIGSAFLFRPTRSAKATDFPNDYPSNLASAAKDSLTDPWGFYNRECASFVAWRLNHNNGIAFKNNGYNGTTAHFGDTQNWGAVATSIGIAVNNTPAVGAVAWWYFSATAGHVAWVVGINQDGSVRVQDYNWTYDGNFLEHTLTSAPTGYIHFKDLASPPPPVPWSFENLEGGTGAISPHAGNVGITPTSVTFNNQLYIFYYDQTNGDLRVAYTHPGWVFDVVDGEGGGNGKLNADVGQAPSAVVFNSTVYVFYYDNTNGNLVTNHRDCPLKSTKSGRRSARATLQSSRRRAEDTRKDWPKEHDSRKDWPPRGQGLHA